MPLIARVYRLGCWLFRFTLSMHVGWCKCCLLGSFSHGGLIPPGGWPALVIRPSCLWLHLYVGTTLCKSPAHLFRLTPRAPDKIVSVRGPYWWVELEWFAHVMHARAATEPIMPYSELELMADGDRIPFRGLAVGCLLAVGPRPHERAARERSALFSALQGHDATSRRMQCIVSWRRHTGSIAPPTEMGSAAGDIP